MTRFFNRVGDYTTLYLLMSLFSRASFPGPILSTTVISDMWCSIWWLVCQEDALLGETRKIRVTVCGDPPISPPTPLLPLLRNPIPASVHGFRRVLRSWNIQYMAFPTCLNLAPRPVKDRIIDNSHYAFLHCVLVPPALILRVPIPDIITGYSLGPVWVRF